MDSDTPHEPANLVRSAAAFAVHVFTACGAGCALLALTAAVNGQWAVMFVWLGIALGIDGVDGTFARRLQVAKLLPRWSGEVLDLVVDILSYVFVPAYALAASGLLPKPAAVPLGLLIVVSGALYFADRLMKTSDYYFRGFPALWNVAAFYLFVLKPEPWAGAVAIVALAVLTFVPFHGVPCASRIGAASQPWRSRLGRCWPSQQLRKISTRRCGSAPRYARWLFISSRSDFFGATIHERDARAWTCHLVLSHGLVTWPCVSPTTTYDRARFSSHIPAIGHDGENNGCCNARS
jgi:phosphatidylcholine synthase